MQKVAFFHNLVIGPRTARPPADLRETGHPDVLRYEKADPVVKITVGVIVFELCPAKVDAKKATPVKS